VAERVTAGSGREEYPSAAPGGRLVFSSLNQNIDIWSLPVDVNDGRITGSMMRLTEKSSEESSPAATADGRILVYESNRTGNRDVWMKDLQSGTETPLTTAAWSEGLPQISPDGAHVAYRITREGRLSVAVLRSADGATRTLCEECSGPYGWAPDGNGLLARPMADTRSISLYSDSSAGPQTLFKHPEFVLYEARFSPNGQWVAFHSLNGPTTRQMFIAPFRGPQQVPVEEWIAIDDGSQMDRNLAWSPDGNMLYFLSDRDGFRCIWAQRLERANKKPLGPAFNVVHFHQASRSMVDAGFNIAVTPNSLVFALTDLTGNIWMVEPEATP
jgi:Tol biopolymer transport system component